MNKCNLVRDLLPLYVDDALSEDSRAFVERHLKACPACAEEAEKLKAPVPEEAALASVQTKKEQKENDRKRKDEPIRKIRRRFIISTISIALVAAGICGACVFAISSINNEIARKEDLIYFNGWETTESIIRTMSIGSTVTLDEQHDEERCDLNGKEQPYYEYIATPYQRVTLGEEDDLLFKFRVPFPMTGQPQEEPFRFQYIYTETGEVFEAPGLEFKRNYLDVAELITRYSFPLLYDYLERNPELYDPVEFVLFVLSYEYIAITTSSSDEEIAFANELRRTTSFSEIWGIDPNSLRHPDHDLNGIPLVGGRHFVPIEGLYRGYAMFIEDTVHINLMVNGELWEIEWTYPENWLEVPGDWEWFPMELLSGNFQEFIHHLEFIPVE